MQTHTLRNKASATPVLTLTPKFLEKVLACYPEAFNLALHWFNGQYAQLTGKKVRLDYEQTQLLATRVNASESGEWVSKFGALPPKAYRLVTLVERGFLRESGIDFEEALDVAQELYAMLDKTYLSPSSA